MIKIEMITIGRWKESWLTEAIQEYTQRLRTTVEITWTIVKDNEALEAAVSKAKNPICLDPSGSLFSSEKFSSLLLDQGARMSFVIGGAEGLPTIIRQKYRLVSLSPLTFTHQMTRLILLEQIYRGYELARGSPYHK